MASEIRCSSPICLLSDAEYTSRFIDPFCDVLRAQLLQDRPLDILQYLQECISDHKNDRLRSELKKRVVSMPSAEPASNQR
jgi:hypothetical protein